MHSRLKTAEIALAAVTTTGLVIAMLGTGNWGMGVSTLASTLLLGLIFYTKDFDLGKVSEQHKNTSDALWHLREKYLDLLTDLQTEAASPDNIMRRRDTLREELNSVYSCALVTSTEAYAAAQKALQLNEDLTFSEIEIDMLLPIGLRKITVPDSE